jgi:hypothetical protein
MRPPRLLAPLLLLLLASGCHPRLPLHVLGFGFVAPAPGLLSLAADDRPVAVRVSLPLLGRVETLEVRVDGAPALDLAGGGLTLQGRAAVGSLGVLPEGRHQLEARALVRFLFFRFPLQVHSWLERVALDRPDQCEILNDVECLLPFPSSRFLVPADTRTGVRVEYPQGALPTLLQPLEAAAFSGQDGFSPGVQVLMHFRGGVDPALSGASRLLPDTRTVEETSLRRSSPTLLLDASAGMRPVRHWIERDVRAASGPAPEREVLFLRPAETLTAGHRYVVAMRHLVSPDGAAVEAEPVFAALRDRRPSDIPALEARRAASEQVFAKLARAGVRRADLVLAFDFVVQSDEDLTGAMLAMRDRSFEWLADQSAPTFTVSSFAAPGTSGDVSIEYDCSAPGQRTWRQVRGHYQVPLFLSSDPLLDPVTGGRLVDEDGDGLPEAQGLMEAPFAITIPCAVLDPATPPLRPILTGHGLFGDGRSVVDAPQRFGEIELAHGGPDFLRIAGATDWLGLSSNDFTPDNILFNFIVQSVLLRPSEFGALPDRLRQGMTNALVLARMLREGRFDGHPAFDTPDGRGVFADPSGELDYFGISLGGIMGTWFAATSPDVGRVALDVPAANFSILIQRSTAIGLIDFALNLLNPDPMVQALFFALGEELWDSAEPVGYLRRVTRDPLPGSGAPKDLLYTVAEFDGVVANAASEIAIRSLGLPNLLDTQGDEGSSVAGLPDIPDRAPPLGPGDPRFAGATVWYDAGMYGDLSDPTLLPFVPPLTNRSVSSGCDPHGRTLQIPAQVRQITTWLDEGVIESFCDGLCDARATGGGFEPFEIPEGAAEPCDPR